ncbi:MAG: alpha/beta fold hydrolase [Balneolaceae bacterium]
MSQKNISKVSGSVPSSEDLPIYYDLYTPASSLNSVVPVILFVHGFKGFKDWGAFPDTCEELARVGFAVVAFNFSLNGIGENMYNFDQPEQFMKETLSQDLDDVERVISALKTKDIESGKATLDTDRIGIIGHSRGGHTAIAAAAEYSEIQCLVTWSAVADYNARWSKQMISDWEKNGYTEVKNSRTGEILKLNRVVYDDAREHADRLMAIKRVQELYIPSLFIAGKNDESVPFRDSQELFRKSPADEKEIRLIENTGHTFGVSHPFEEQDFPAPFAEVLDHTEGWFLDHLK